MQSITIAEVTQSVFWSQILKMPVLLPCPLRTLLLKPSIPGRTLVHSPDGATTDGQHKTTSHVSEPSGGWPLLSLLGCGAETRCSILSAQESYQNCRFVCNFNFCLKQNKHFFAGGGLVYYEAMETRTYNFKSSVSGVHVDVKCYFS